jgi:rod shape determining protein RodA
MPAFLIVLQPDMGSAVVFLALSIVLFREGMSPYILISGFLMLVLFFFTLIFNNAWLALGLISTACSWPG